MDQPLDRRRLEAVAMENCGLEDFGDVAYVEALECLIDALEREAAVDGERRAAAAQTLIGTLVKRLRLVADRSENPAIADEVIDKPVFIVGLPRTGSTHLHGLMEEISASRTPKLWEGSTPSPPPEAATADTDPRIQSLQEMLEFVPQEMHVRHSMDARRPEQCNLLMDWTFLNQTMLASYDIPSYRHYIYGADYAPAYVAHRRTLQQLQWRHPGRWVLKYPKHLMSLDALIAEYPDAVYVWTHRDPAVVVPSVASLTGYMRSQSTPGYDSRRHGPEWTTLEEFALRRGLEFRDRLLDPAQVFDVHYGDLVADPVGTVEAICDHAGLPCTSDDLASIERYQQAHPRGERGRHDYSAEEYGLTEDGLRRRFAFYTERFSVRLEPTHT